MPTVFIGGKQRQFEKGTTFEAAVSDLQEKYNGTIALVYFNGKMRELSKKIEKDGVISLITTKDAAGNATYTRTATMMLCKAVRDITQNNDIHIKVEFTLGNAFFCSVKGDIEVDDEFAEKINAAMKEMSSRNLPITKKTYPSDDAIALFHHQGMDDKERLFHFRTASTINVYALDGYYDYYYGYMLPATGYVRNFNVEAYKGGLLLHLPDIERPNELDEFVEQKNLYDQFMLNTEWGELVGISTVGDLNEKICEGNINDMILVQEALQERRIGDIAEEIYSRPDVKFVLVAGPSSSGKTTFSHRLSIQLQSFGLRPHILSMDNWFVNREKTPVDIDGNYNFDVIEAIDLDLFNSDMLDLLDGEEIELPTFDFKLGKRQYKGKKLRLDDNDILIIEGIHGLNPLSTEDLPDENKFKIYISALTSLNVDEHNRIPSSDTRLLRRMVRDARMRGYNAQETIARWKSVRESEEKYIFPYQQDVDAVFNSCLIYEQAVLKQFAEPLLFNVRKDEPEYYEAKRLLKFLDYFVGVDTAPIPANSICREFVGGGCFNIS